MDEGVLARGHEEVVELAKRQAARLAKKLSGKTVAVRSFVRSGKPFNEITALAGERGADLIVIATHGHTGLKRVWLGSTAERVVRHAPCPVLTVPAQSKKGRKREASALKVKRIVVPIDFSQTSAQALPYAVALAERFGAEIILLHVIPPVPLPLPFYVRRLLQKSAGRLAELSMDVQLSRLCEEAFDKEMPSRTLVRTGAPYDEISKAASSQGADLIILTTHGYTGLKHASLGSTAERVVRHATCPVLVVRDKAHVGGGKPSTRRQGRS
jgi:nucleotide-binding universal stress UspA family protein